ncbi:MAG: hypothetical protein COS76_02325 [Candidatus Portnoybacteria bacterium CG06_land_8_20_14_3_00_39_12]|uniref:Uncharacterized protein n=1 Tax=Candidatus Portnoybacteria bacterium CG06_land_8_20_14_3_00_39_12 TaxID=1974809 RepID=A0A2M7AX68_9BACT|nr:MAG: hypothetical protein COS76_02325 [Candidatus Portnoybacteria bacterium CG06_land_8_20_14_3_00_39_12]
MNEERRKFLRILLIGMGAFLLWKILPREFSFFNSKKELSVGKKFRTIEEGEKLIFFNEKGEKLFTVNKEGEFEIGD